MSERLTDPVACWGVREHASARDLKRICDKAPRAELLAALVELARRRDYVLAGEATLREKVDGPKGAHAAFWPLFQRATSERLAALFLDANNWLIHRAVISVGSLNTTRTVPREILRPAILHNSLGVILGHNHPSGNPEPSPEDIEFTRAVRRAGELVGVEVYDHLILAGRSYTSLRERGVLG